MVTRAFPIGSGISSSSPLPGNIGLVRAVRCKLRIVLFDVPLGPRSLQITWPSDVLPNLGSWYITAPRQRCLWPPRSRALSFDALELKDPMSNV
jgi:hypothetical protein